MPKNFQFNRADRLIAGIDEAGRGPLAGPVTAACVVLPADYRHCEITDSKKLSPQKREVLFDEICRVALAWSVVSVGARRIDAFNIRRATAQAMALAAARVYRQLNPQGLLPEQLHLQIDGNMKIDTPFSQETIIKGDAKVQVIGAASILAKVTRDRLMLRLDELHPMYGFSGHKGYPTSAHVEQIKKFGPSCVHRRTFGGVREFCVPTSQAAPLGSGPTAPRNRRGSARRPLSTTTRDETAQAEFAFGAGRNRSAV